MKKSDYMALREGLWEDYREEIEFYENTPACESPAQFGLEYIWVVLSSGMKNQIAQKIHKKVLHAILDGRPVLEVFGHRGKAAAIEEVWAWRRKHFNEYLMADDKLAYLEALPWVGSTTKFHLAKNLGMDVCKPDRHLVRIAEHYGTTPGELCARLAKESGDRVATVDYVLWRAANLGLLDLLVE